MPVGVAKQFHGQHLLTQPSPSITHTGDLKQVPYPLLSILRRTENAVPSRPRATASRAEVVPQPGKDFYGIPNPSPGTRLRLDDLRERLIRQEETIIFAFIERAQFRLNPVIYERGAFPIPDFDGTFSQYLLYELEKVYSRVRRYTSPDEHPFASAETLPPPLLEPLDYPKTLMPNKINYSAQIEAMYRENILPVVCEDGDDQNYGSSATCDVACLQALSKRVHYGKFIAEAKYQESPERYAALASAGDRDGIWNLLSNDAVEQVLLERVAKKARNYGMDITHGGAHEVYKVEPEAISEIYRAFIIPLTKVVEVDYLMERWLIDQ